MKLSALFNFILPKQPVNRNVFLVGVLIIFYVAWKSYVLSTPTPDDDQLPDQVKEAVLKALTEDK